MSLSGRATRTPPAAVTVPHGPSQAPGTLPTVGDRSLSPEETLLPAVLTRTDAHQLCVGACEAAGTFQSNLSTWGGGAWASEANNGRLGQSGVARGCEGLPRSATPGHRLSEPIAAIKRAKISVHAL